MNVFLVINRPRDWPFEIPGAITVPASTYLTDPAYAENRSARVLNLCRTDRYQSRGYYVSLLAEARGHHPLPEVRTIEDIQADDLTHLVGASFNEQLQQLLANHSGARCEMNVYFGREPSGQHNELAQQLFNLLHAPLIRARLEGSLLEDLVTRRFLPEAGTRRSTPSPACSRIPSPHHEPRRSLARGPARARCR